MLDNVIKHGAPLRGGRILARVGPSRRSPGDIELAFLFKSPSFAAFAGGGAGTRSAPPRFDPESRRWRGLGLAMCRSLSRWICYSPGPFVDRIVLVFDGSDEGA